MSGTIPESTACERRESDVPIAACFAEMIRQQTPNLLRPYVNPQVVQACYLLSRSVEAVWPEVSPSLRYRVFLANSFEEALSGAVKLARYALNEEGRRPDGAIFDPTGRLDHFADTRLGDGERVEYIPRCTRYVDVEDFAAAEVFADAGFVAMPADGLDDIAADVGATTKHWSAGGGPLSIVWLGRGQLAAGALPAVVRFWHGAPDIVVFDESLVDGEVPFGAFAATDELLGRWRRRGMGTFHSTTFQPNAVASMQLLRCLRRYCPTFYARHDGVLRRIESGGKFCHQTYAELYSPSLVRLAKLTGFAHNQVRASGHYVATGGRRVFDGVAGVACSVRGHNPPSFVAETADVARDPAYRAEFASRLHELSGLAHALPAVSGASAVEQALKLALASQWPRGHVLALRGGFGGKTLVALTGTWKPSLRRGLDPLYPHVVYVDPFAEDAPQAIAAAFERYPIGVVQLELIQAVGGVRAVPPRVVDELAQRCARHDSLLFVDEVQTGMFRTGAFLRSTGLGIEPDLVTIGKGTSDMMFPSAMTLYSDRVQQALDDRGCTMAADFQERYGYETTYTTLLATLRRSETVQLAARVAERGALFQRLLDEGLRDCANVRAVRCFGLLIGIELGSDAWLRRRRGRWLDQLYLLAMLRHRTFPLLMGFCQYEPHVLKLTPPLSISEQEVRQVCATIGDVLHRPMTHVALAEAARAVFARG
ncbi:MAG: aminotransferase class III-fold pyridoxal phosphate-dependent enzyme [Pirellulales bacterium]